MLFTTDKQTLEDLNIFGKHGGNSIYNIFNRCSTRGGAAIMEDMFRYPLSDEKAINKRANAIRFFAAARIAFPFNSALFDAIDNYLANTDERTRLSTQEQTIGKKLGNIIAVDADTQQIYKGIQALVELMHRTKQFLDENSQNTITGPDEYKEDREAMRAVLLDPVFAPVLEAKGKLSHAAMASLDVLLRFRHRDAIQKLLRFIFYLDVYVSVAEVATERQFVFPKALPGSAQTVRLEGVYHPQVKGAVPNSLYITPESNLIFLTGANMAGKSTFMKSVSIALFLAHMGFPVAASKMEFAVFDGIYTTINLPDNLGMGASHFYAEVLRVKKMAHELSESKRLFIVFDELFRGTNVKDAYEATIAITAGFASKTNSMFIISTHIIEAGDVLGEKCRNISFNYLPTKMNGNLPVYTYQLEQGITADRHGMVIINNENILGILKQGKKKVF